MDPSRLWSKKQRAEVGPWGAGWGSWVHKVHMIGNKRKGSLSGSVVHDDHECDQSYSIQATSGAQSMQSVHQARFWAICDPPVSCPDPSAFYDIKIEPASNSKITSLFFSDPLFFVGPFTGHPRAESMYLLFCEILASGNVVATD